MRHGQNIGIDFGTSNFLAYSREKGILLCEPAMAAVDRIDGRIIAIGTEAHYIVTRLPEKFDVVYPIENGMVVNYKIAVGMLSLFLKKICAKQILKPKVVMAVPLHAGELVEKAMVSVAIDAGAVSAVPLREPFAAASGIGFDLSQGKSTMIIDIGAGTTEVSVISMGKMAIGTSSNIAGKRMTQEFLKYIRKEEGIELGERVAEDAIMKIGCLLPKNKEIRTKLYGRSISNGLPALVEISSEIFPQIFSKIAEEICDSVFQVLNRIPPEIAEEVRLTGIHLTGGGSNIDGIEQYMSEKIGISCKKTKNPLQTLAVGAGMWQ